MLVVFLEEIVARDGKRIVFVNPMNTSRECAACGVIDGASRDAQVLRLYRLRPRRSCGSERGQSARAARERPDRRACRRTRRRHHRGDQVSRAFAGGTSVSTQP